MSRTRGSLNDVEANNAAMEAARGGVVGAAKWGVVTALATGVAYIYSPVYRGLTFQFKIYIQMAGMLFGGMVEADSRMRTYEQNVRRWKRVARDAEVWRRYEQDYEEKGVPGVSSEGDVGTGGSQSSQARRRDG